MQTHFSYKNIMEMEQRQRAVFINSLGGFKSVEHILFCLTIC